VVLVVFVLDNHKVVTLGLSPFADAQVWLGPAMLAAVASGFILGLLAHQPRHFSLRRRARNAEKRVAQLTSAQGSGKVD
jgi:uncharacterized integral membrane protein